MVGRICTRVVFLFCFGLRVVGFVSFQPVPVLCVVFVMCYANIVRVFVFLHASGTCAVSDGTVLTSAGCVEAGTVLTEAVIMCAQ